MDLSLLCELSFPFLLDLVWLALMVVMNSTDNIFSIKITIREASMVFISGEATFPFLLR